MEEEQRLLGLAEPYLMVTRVIPEKGNVLCLCGSGESSCDGGKWWLPHSMGLH